MFWVALRWLTLPLSHRDFNLLRQAAFPCLPSDTAGSQGGRARHGRYLLHSVHTLPSLAACYQYQQVGTDSTHGGVSWKITSHIPDPLQCLHEHSKLDQLDCPGHGWYQERTKSVKCILWHYIKRCLSRVTFHLSKKRTDFQAAWQSCHINFGWWTITWHLHDIGALADAIHPTLDYYKMYVHLLYQMCYLYFIFIKPGSLTYLSYCQEGKY